jgi:hypothetical protein
MRPFCVAVFLMCMTAQALADDAVTSSASSRNTKALKVFDANGKAIGLLSSVSGADGVFLSVNGTITFARIVPQTPVAGTPSNPIRYIWGSNYDVGFASTDCSGQPTLDYSVNWPRPSAVLRQGSDATIYVGSDTTTTPASIKSFLSGTTCSLRNGAAQSVPVESSLSLSQKYPEPMTIGY